MPLAPHGDSDMKYIAMFLLCMVLAAPCFAGSCQDMQDAVGGAIQERNGRVSDTHDILMPDPETERDALSGCLGSVNAIGDAFSLGVTLPSMGQIVAGMCSQVNSYINRKINEAHNQVNNAVNGMGGNNPFKVYGTGGDYIVKITGKLKSERRSFFSPLCGCCRMRPLPLNGQESFSRPCVR